jgi:hypothetical protein
MELKIFRRNPKGGKQRVGGGVAQQAKAIADHLFADAL